VWYFDFISPFAYLQWPAIQRLSARVRFTYRPILFAGILQHLDHKGPAEIQGKREFSYRYALWLAQQCGVPMRFPPAHPFNPLSALRLCIAAGTTTESIDAIFSHLWREGRAGDSIDSLRDVARSLGISVPDRALSDPRVKFRLRENFDAALADEVFGVPSIVADGEVFWGNDATAMFEHWLDDPDLFEREPMRSLRDLPQGARRAP
jgi:2-hydroxychromene-2-carboxylate isomerase